MDTKNLRSEPKVQLKQANKAWTDCISKNFLGQWLNGADITVNDVCQEELARMRELDEQVYGTLPFKPQSIQ